MMDTTIAYELFTSSLRNKFWRGRGGGWYVMVAVLGG